MPGDDERNLLRTIIDAAPDLARRRLERERGLAHAVALVLAESNNIRETLPALIRTICEAIDWVYGARWIWDSASSNLRRHEWWSERDPEFDEADRPLWLELVTQSRGGIVRRAWFERHPTWVADIGQVE